MNLLWRLKYPETSKVCLPCLPGCLPGGGGDRFWGRGCKGGEIFLLGGNVYLGGKSWFFENPERGMGPGFRGIPSEKIRDAMRPLGRKEAKMGEKEKLFGGGRGGEMPEKNCKDIQKEEALFERFAKRRFSHRTGKVTAGFAGGGKGQGEGSGADETPPVKPEGLGETDFRYGWGKSAVFSAGGLARGRWRGTDTDKPFLRICTVCRGCAGGCRKICAHTGGAAFYFSSHTMRAAISAGETPEIRLAWPRFRGRTSFSFWRASSRRPKICS